MSDSLKLDRHNLLAILKVAAWSSVSAGLVVILNQLEVLEFPIKYAHFVPMVNTILYSVSEFARKQSVR